MHDIRLTTTIAGFYEGLVAAGWAPSVGNGDIALKERKFTGGRLVKIRVHRTDCITVIVGCSGNPFKASERLSDLAFLLDKLRYDLEHKYPSFAVRVEPIGSWMVVQWHHGVDASREFSGPGFNFTFEDLSGHLVRFYNKKVSSHRFRPRLERIESPHLPFREIVAQLKEDSGV